MSPLLNRFGFVNTRGPKHGHCNICDACGLLTEDHVPPKGTLRVPQAELLHIVELLSAERPLGKKKRRLMQSGVCFRSLCQNCNNVLLGTKYDPELIAFSNSVTLFLKGVVARPEVVTVEVTPGAVVRCVLGHLFAIGIERREKNPLVTEAADFFLDSSRVLPDGIDIYYWVYPYARQVAIRDAIMVTDFFKSPGIHFWCLKYFPLGFMITWGNKRPDRIGLPNLKDYIIGAGGHPARLPLYFTAIPRQDWPEDPTTDGAVFYGDSGIGALPKSS